MKCETLLNSASLKDRKVLNSVGFSVFSGRCPATVSDSETVFLRPPYPVSLAQPQFSLTFILKRMDSNTITPTMAIAAISSAHAGNCNLSTDFKRTVVIKVWDAVSRCVRKYVESEHFLAVHNMPCIVGVTGACENTDMLFTVDWYDGKKMFLPQSNQLYVETLTQKVESGSVHCETQSFCKGLKVDNRRLAQFLLFEIERLGSLNEIISHLSATVASAANQVVQDCAKELTLFDREASDLIDLIFKCMIYADAVELLKTEGFPELVWGDDLEAPHEGRLTELMGGMFVTHHPTDIKFFNMRNDDEDPRVVNSADLLLPWVGERAGAAERESDGTKLAHKLETTRCWLASSARAQSKKISSGTRASTKRTKQRCTRARVRAWAWPMSPSSFSAKQISATACPS